MIVIRCHRCGYVLWAGVPQKTRIGPYPSVNEVARLYRQCPRCGRPLERKAITYRVTWGDHA